MGLLRWLFNNDEVDEKEELAEVSRKKDLYDEAFDIPIISPAIRKKSVAFRRKNDNTHNEYINPTSHTSYASSCSPSLDGGDSGGSCGGGAE